MVEGNEAPMHLDVYMNAESYRLWCPENQHKFRVTSLYLLKIGI